MKQETLKTLADGSNILTAGTGVSSTALGMLEAWDFVNTNAAGIGVMLTLFFGLIAIAFNFYNSAKLGKADKNEVALAKHVDKLDDHGDRLDDHIKESNAKFEQVNSGIDKILVKLTDNQQKD